MNLHSLKTTPGSRRPRKRVARGRSSGSGKTGGRGTKGQMSRKGHKRKAGFEGGQMRLIRRLPKRGFRNPGQQQIACVNVGQLARFEDGTEITAAVLKTSGLVRGPCDGIKILGEGDLSRKLIVRVGAFSASARAKIEAAGGVCEVVEI
jgi:large subunit ribosomal protein L15